ncbi:MAG: DDE-type integrase/transposase/recombinase, partial [Planctomycetes bacterium]|nr:DDE-type integrase/transposase/recombinase [Planctomycetota bacterium]
TEDFIRALENAFHHFGGVPKTLIPDNLKAAVIKADWFDPDLNPKIEEFCRHYGTVVLPAKPRMARHKGKVEAGVKFVQSNALKGRTFASLADQNRFLLDWEASVADTRIHGTTRKQVGKVFQDVERAALLPLPVDRFPFFHEAKRSVHRDGHVAVDKAYYSVPPEYLAREVWARWDSRMVRIFDLRMHQIAVHLTHQSGKFSTLPQHIAKEKISGVERGAAYLMNKASLIGSNATRWAESMLQERGIQGVRVLQGLLSLASRHGDKDVEQACEIAQSHGAYRLRVIRELIKRRGNKQEQFEFMDDHPIIRSLDDYEQFVQTAFLEANA